MPHTTCVKPCHDCTGTGKRVCHQCGGRGRVSIICIVKEGGLTGFLIKAPREPYITCSSCIPQLGVILPSLYIVHVCTSFFIDY